MTVGKNGAWYCNRVTSLNSEGRIVVYLRCGEDTDTEMTVELGPGESGAAEVFKVMLTAAWHIPRALPSVGEVVAAAAALSPEQTAEVTGGRTRRATVERMNREVDIARTLLDDVQRTSHAVEMLMRMGMSRSTAFRRLREARA